MSEKPGVRGRTAVSRAVAGLLSLGLAGILALAAGCTLVVDGEPTAMTSELDAGPPTPPAPVQGGTGSRTDQLAATLVAGIEGYWRDAFPTQFGRRWVNIHGFYAVNPQDPAPPPCIQRALDLSDQALYCPQRDVVIWDRVELIPRLVNTYGPGAAMVALAHEIGHSVQNRIGIDATVQVTEKDRYPTILIEGMADCFTGSVLRAAVDGRVPNVQISRPDLDRALRALLTFRDPVSIVGGIPDTAHGDAFDRASAFTDGYTNGPTSCAGMTLQNQVFTQRGYTSFADQAAQGNLILTDLLQFLSEDAKAWFGQLVTTRGRPWQAPALAVNLTGPCPAGAAAQGPARFCPNGNTISVSTRDLRPMHDSLGDYASGVLLASRYAMSAMSALGKPVTGADASRTALCLTGAYTRAVFDRRSGFGLSPGDIDEAVDELLDEDFAARDVAGVAPSGDLGFERVQRFRAGVLGGPDKCGV